MGSGNPVNLSVSLTAGNVLVLGLYQISGSDTSISFVGGGIGLFTEGPASGFPGPGQMLLWAPVFTTGPSTLTISGSSGLSIIGQEFSYSTGTVFDPVHWGFDNGVAASGNYPSVTPPGLSQLYLAFLDTDTASSGSSAGFTYVNFPTSTVRPVQFVYNPNVSTPTAYAPPWTQAGVHGYADVVMILAIHPITSKIVMLV
jgi:hypothetical protein